MEKVFLSFLGKGTRKNDIYDYSEVEYRIEGRGSLVNKFVQVAELGIIGASYFDQIIIAATQSSYKLHFDTLQKEIFRIGGQKIHAVILDEDMSAQGQWEWFEKILGAVPSNSELSLDLTHGYRSIPIVFSTAVNFMQRARGILLNAVYYGVFEMSRDLGYAPIVDLKDFYVVNDWAEGVSRLVEDADTGKIAHLASMGSSFQMAALSDPKLIQKLKLLTSKVKSVDVNNIGSIAAETVDRCEYLSKEASVAGKALLNLISSKFMSISSFNQGEILYNKQYFRVQSDIIRLLLEHGLHMQAYTAMRELIGSVGMLGLRNRKLTGSIGRKYRKRFAEVFINMIQIDELKWNFINQNEKDKQELLPFYRKIQSDGIISILKDFAVDLINLRNGFDHAWTQKSGANAGFDQQGERFLSQIEKVIDLLEDAEHL
jgi:CRISPR-associated DxTHG motif protein